jgi:hypothetical protein
MTHLPAVHYSMGGLWTQFVKGSYSPAEARKKHASGTPAPIDWKVGQGMLHGAATNMMTNIEGLYAFGEVNFAYHGANRLAPTPCSRALRRPLLRPLRGQLRARRQARQDARLGHGLRRPSTLPPPRKPIA